MLSIYLTGLFLIAVVSLAVTMPFFRQEEPSGDDGAAPENPWRRRKLEALAGIRDAELDFHLGKLSEDDYRDMRRRLEAEALEAMKHVDD